MLTGVLARAAAAVDKIIKDPIGFVHNLVNGVKAGLDNFVANIGTHLQKGLMGWLLGTLADAGIQLPETFDLKGILSLVMQVLGLTYPNIRKRAVSILGEGIVGKLEEAAEIFKILITQGPSGLWDYIKDKIGDLKATVIDGIKSFVTESVVVAGITWIVSLLNPASAFVKAAKAIYDIVMFFVNNGSKIMSLVNAIIDSVSAIADGNIGVAAAAVEKALGKAVAPAISFLASLLGLGGISEKIRSIIEKIQGPINTAIDWVIHKAVSLVKSIGGLFGGKKKEDKISETNDPEHDAKIQAGLLDIDQEEQKYIKDGRISRVNAEKIVIAVKKKHAVFKSISVVEAGDRWNYHYTGSDGGTKEGELKDAPTARFKIKKIQIDDKEIQGAIKAAKRHWLPFETEMTRLVTSGAFPEVEEEFAKPGSELGQWKTQERIPGTGTIEDEALAKFRKPDILREVKTAGSILEVHALEITMEKDFTKVDPSASSGPTGREDALRKATQIFHTMHLLKEKYDNIIESDKEAKVKVIFVYHIFTPTPNTEEEKNTTALLKEMVDAKKAPFNARIIWYHVP
jgi:hypothetical protein